jgi:hypothetical protein
MRYIVQGKATVSCCTVVEADSIEQALEIAGERQLADFTGMVNPFYEGMDEAFYFENDGTPADLTAVPE